jgi:hypothetical protein
MIERFFAENLRENPYNYLEGVTSAKRLEVIGHISEKSSSFVVVSGVFSV